MQYRSFSAVGGEITMNNQRSACGVRRLMLGFTLVGTSVGMTQGVSADAVLNPNQISGEIQFTNSNPQILSILENEGMMNAYVRANSVGTTPTLSSYSYPQASSGRTTPYELTVEAAESGTTYQVSADLWMDNRGDLYRVDAVQSAPVFPEPAEDVSLNLQQCAAVLDVRFVDTAGNPVAVSGGNLLALREMEAGTGRYMYQAQDRELDPQTTQEYLVVNGDGSNYRVDMTYESGTDPFSNEVRGRCREVVPVGCDQVVPLVCTIAPGGELGQVSGKVDMLGEQEHSVSNFTRMYAFNGPLGNYRYDQAGSDGSFLMENMVPSDAENPSKNYMLYGQMLFRTGLQTQYLRTAWLDGYRNDSVRVEAGKTTDLGSTFVMDPGYIHGSVELVGPKTSDALLNDLYRDIERDYNNDNIPDDVLLNGSRVQARGAYGVAEGANSNNWGAEARTLFDGSYDAGSAKFMGNYELVLGGLNGESSLWTLSDLALMFKDQRTPEVPESFQYNWLQLTDRQVVNHQVDPGSRQQMDHSYCMSEVQLSYRSLSGTFFNPWATASGDFIGTDYLNREANYGIRLGYALGTPRMASQASDKGMVSMTLPQGNYVITPHVSAVNPNGGYSNTELPPVELNVGCRQSMLLTTELQLNLDEVPQQTEEDILVISGTVSSSGDVERISYTHNGGDDQTICENCEPESKFMAEVTLVDGANEIVVNADSTSGDRASVTTQVDYAAPQVVYEPVAIKGCNDIAAEVPVVSTGAEVDFTVTGSGGCGVPKVSCDHNSGDFFGVGSTKVSCQAIDACGGASAQCSFTIDLAREEVKPEPKGDETCEGNEETLLVQSVNKTLLWPPNHKMVDVGLNTKLEYGCKEKELPSVWRTGTEVWSDELELVKGSGNFAPDSMTDKDRLELRAERQGNSDGRVYLLIGLAASEAGDAAIQCDAVVVPHSKSQKDIESVSRQAQDAVAYCEKHDGKAPPGFVQHGVVKPSPANVASAAGENKTKAKPKSRKKK
jgi:HYR domain